MDLPQDDSYNINPIVVPPSPPRSTHDFQSPYGQDFNDLVANSIGSPSFQGSYYSPFSGHSELSFGNPEHDVNLNIIDHDSPIGLGLHTEYDPNEFDGSQTSPSSLLMYQDTEFMPQFNSLSASPSDPRGAYDYSSPSSNGDPSSDRRSRASSISSNHAPNNNSYTPSSGLDVAQSFENLNVRSPNWGTNPLPPTKSMSPPRLMMPDDHSADVKPPTINAPDGDGGVDGPQFNIVPATPIGSGQSVANSTLAHPTLETLHQGSALSMQQQHWHSALNQQSAVTAGQTYNSVQKAEYNFPPSQPTTRNDNFASATNVSITSPPHIGQVLDDSGGGTSGFLGVPPRARSKSDTSRELPIWNQTYQPQQQLTGMGSAVIDEATVNMNDVLPGAQQPQLNPTFTFGQGSSKLDNFLSPDSNSIRRSKSDAGSRSLHRQSRSETIRGSNMLPTAHQPGHQHSHSSSGQFLIPPVGNMEYLSPSNSQQFYNGGSTSPDGPLPSIGGRSVSPGRSLTSSPGHIRRTSSGHQHRVSPYPSPHGSPNPRVKELPYEGGLEYSGGIDGSLGFSQQQQVYNSAYGGLPGSYSPTSTAASAYHTPGQSPSPGPPLTMENSVPKPTVTTGRTANASHRRRKQDAPFVCPVLGCGSTFTRSFNLKGHIRSHNEEKPFLCKWPGCGKGFARQHDCKRHEQLHQNYRPFSCEGCGKQFARMDALNRHLRSDGGSDCLKLHEASTTVGKAMLNGKGNNESLRSLGGLGIGGGVSGTKAEDKSWAAAVAL